MKHMGEIDWKRIGFGMAVSGLVTLAVTAAGAWILDREWMDVQWINYLAALILLVSSFAGAKSAGGGENRWVTSGLVGAGYLFVLLILNALLFEGNLSGAGETALAVLGGCGAAVLLSGRGSRRPRRRKHRNR